MTVTLNNLPKSLPSENAVHLELVDGVVVFKATTQVRTRVEDLVDKERAGSLTLTESAELDAYEDVDDYLSYVNRLIRNSAENGELNLAA